MTPPRWMRMALWPASALYQAAARSRVRTYRWGLLRRRRLDGVVISVGNLTVGGTGKTPMVLWIVERLLAEGRRVGILTRGYRASGPRGAVQSDEVAVLRARLGTKALFGIGADRYAKGKMLERHGVEWFVLDDGFQHVQLCRDADVVLIDATEPFGGGYCLPAGRLREPKSALARADLIVITRSSHAPAVETIIRHHSAAPIFYAQVALDGIFEASPEPGTLAMAAGQSRNFFAFCGIGNAGAFFDDLRRWGLTVVGVRAFADHHVYTAEEAVFLGQQARDAGADALLCTEKDLFNLRGGKCGLPLCFCRIRMELPQAEEFWGAILRVIAERRPGAAA